MDKENATERSPPLEPRTRRRVGSLLQEWLEPLSEEDREAHEPDRAQSLPNLH